MSVETSHKKSVREYEIWQPKAQLEQNSREPDTYRITVAKIIVVGPYIGQSTIIKDTGDKLWLLPQRTTQSKEIEEGMTLVIGMLSGDNHVLNLIEV